MATEYIELAHPGEMLKEDVLAPLGISQNRLTEATGIPKSAISEIVNGKRAFTADTSIRIGRALGMSEGYWLRLQSDYDLRLAMQGSEGLEIGQIVVTQ